MLGFIWYKSKDNLKCNSFMCCFADLCICIASSNAADKVVQLVKCVFCQLNSRFGCWHLFSFDETVFIFTTNYKKKISQICFGLQRFLFIYYWNLNKNFWIYIAYCIWWTLLAIYQRRRSINSGKFFYIWLKIFFEL